MDSFQLWRICDCMYVYRTYKIYISLSADFKKSFNLLLLQKTEGIAFSSLKRVANVTACRALERWCWGGIKWAWDQVTQANNLPFPLTPQTMQPTGEDAVPSLLQAKEVKTYLSLAATGRLSDTITSAHLSDCSDLTPFLTTFWFVFLTEVGLQAKTLAERESLATTPPCRQNRTCMAHATSFLLRQTLSYQSQHRHQITLLGLEREQIEEQIRHRELDSAACKSFLHCMNSGMQLEDDWHGLAPASLQLKTYNFIKK